MFLGFTGKVYAVLLREPSENQNFFGLLMNIGAGSPGELRAALIELREAGLLVLTNNVKTLERRIISSVRETRLGTDPSPSYHVRMAAVRASLRKAVLHGRPDKVDLDALSILIEDHRRITTELPAS